MDNFLKDLRFALRGLVRAPRLTFAALACTALGIGSAVFMFTLINAVLLQPPPFPDAERLTRVRLMQEDGGGQGDLSYLEFQDVREQAKSFDALEMASRTRLAVTGGEVTERIRGEAVTPGYFKMIDMKPAMGRLFTAEEHTQDANRVVLIGNDLWERRYGSDPEILGKPFRVRSRTAPNSELLFTIIGVMPEGFTGTVDLDLSEFWIPLEQTPLRAYFEMRDVRNNWTIARLKPGTTFEAAKSEIEAIGSRIDAANPGLYKGLDLILQPFGESWRVRPRTGLLMLTVAAFLLLLIGCTNIASLLLARLAQREHELTMRFVLGAQRRWVFRQLLVESFLLSILGGLIGTLLAFWAVKLFAAAKLLKLPNYVSFTPDFGVVVLAMLLVLLTGALFGVLPAWFGTRVNAQQQLQGAGRSVSLGRRQRFFGQSLVVLEVTFTFILVIGAMLMVRTYLNLSRGDLGFRTENVLRMSVSLDSIEFPEAQDWLNFSRNVKEAIRNYPGVRGVALMNETLPPWHDMAFDVALDGTPNDDLRDISRHAIDNDFLKVLDIDLKYGRAFTPNDRLGTAQVALVNEALARFIAGGNDPRSAIGKRFQLVNNREPLELSEPHEIVGIVESILYRGPRPVVADVNYDYDIYVPLEQALSPVFSMAIVTEGDAAAMNLPLQREIGRLAPTSPLHWISTMEEELGLQFGDARFYAYLTLGYSICALLLAGLGIYSVLAHSVNRRFGELGIRMAVGAHSIDIIRLVVGQGMRTLLIGLVLGAGIAILGTRLVASLLYGVAPSDPLTFVMVASILILLGLAACYVPARRATRIDPVAVLRNE